MSVVSRTLSLTKRQPFSRNIKFKLRDQQPSCVCVRTLVLAALVVDLRVSAV